VDKINKIQIVISFQRDLRPEPHLVRRPSHPSLLV
jgi:hypothetical protein